MVTAQRVSWDRQYFNGSVPRPPAVDWNGLGHFLHPEAAAQLRLMSADFEKEFGKPILTSETDRTIAEQVRLFNLYQSGQGYPAATPGWSTHGECVAMDVYSFVYRNSYDTPEHKWLRENGPAYGWDWYLVGAPSDELWHLNYIFGLRRIIAPAWGTTTTPPEAPAPAPFPMIGDVMIVVQNQASGRSYTFGYFPVDGRLVPGLKHHADPEQLRVASEAANHSAGFNDLDFTRFLWDYGLDALTDAHRLADGTSKTKWLSTQPEGALVVVTDFAKRAVAVLV